MRSAAVAGVFLLVQAVALGAQAAPTPATHHRPEERMDVVDVLAAGDGQFMVVLKTASKPTRLLPIWVQEAEAVTLKLRLDRRAPGRPFTLNLVEQLLRATNIKVTEITIDDFKDGLFLGKIRLKQNARSWDMDARPSDAIGLAMGRHLPIFVAREIIDGAGIDPSALPSTTRHGHQSGDGSTVSNGKDPSAYDETL